MKLTCCPRDIVLLWKAAIIAYRYLCKLIKCSRDGLALENVDLNKKLMLVGYKINYCVVNYSLFFFLIYRTFPHPLSPHSERSGNSGDFWESLVEGHGGSAG